MEQLDSAMKAIVNPTDKTGFLSGGRCGIGDSRTEVQLLGVKVMEFIKLHWKTIAGVVVAPGSGVLYLFAGRKGQEAEEQKQKALVLSQQQAMKMPMCSECWI